MAPEKDVRVNSGAALRGSITIDFYDSLGKALRGFLRQIVTDAVLDDPVQVFAREFLGIGLVLH